MMMLTSRITMMLVHEVLDCVQVAIGTGQREWSVTSLIECTCTCTSVLNDGASFGLHNSCPEPYIGVISYEYHYHNIKLRTLDTV